MKYSHRGNIAMFPPAIRLKMWCSTYHQKLLTGGVAYANKWLEDVPKQFHNHIKLVALAAKRNPSK